MRKNLILYVCALLSAATAAAQNDYDGRFSRPLGQVLAEVSEMFGTEFEYAKFMPDTMMLRFADSRIRRYSLEQTLDNICRAADLKWSRSGKRYKIQPYEYYRRVPADGVQLIEWLTSLYGDREEWERRREVLIGDVRRMMNADAWRAAAVAEPDVILSKERRMDGYTVRRFALETLPGVYVCGAVYAPVAKGRHPLIVAPSGHWDGGRLRPDHQRLMATLARMGAVAVDMDIVGWGDSEVQISRQAHPTGYSMQLQALWSLCVTDWVIGSRKDIDVDRIGVTGGSGGATHALLLAMLDERVAAAAPVAHLVAYFDGGCTCESGVPVAQAGGESCLTELLATLAPKPVLVVSDGGDWTVTYPESEYPFLRRIWGFYGAEERVTNRHFPNEGHDYGVNKRRAVYEFFADVFGLNLSRADESRVEVLPQEELRSFAAGKLPEGAVRSREELENIVRKIR